MTVATTERIAMTIREEITLVMLLVEEAEASVVSMRGHLMKRMTKASLLKIAWAEAVAVAVEGVMQEPMEVAAKEEEKVVTSGEEKKAEGEN
ncbi:hypothetical protein AXG93_1881s1210 [Marchantia polymorpha subsp. ruderalis]|uniref:Uncharacterized protein n=1 Tax=Marchantia polymorpha subsp. ruderalis TaxID=1480154 RepID=A0A176W477_MARPO|nr:hypothetical protein AXG93_1881s1210 [Marchantia polymorpha subsp. ruderalis]